MLPHLLEEVHCVLEAAEDERLGCRVSLPHRQQLLQQQTADTGGSSTELLRCQQAQVRPSSMQKDADASCVRMCLHYFNIW